MLMHFTYFCKKFRIECIKILWLHKSSLNVWKGCISLWMHKSVDMRKASVDMRKAKIT